MINNQGGRGDGDPHPHPHGGGDGDGVGMKFSQVGIPTCKILPFQILIQILTLGEKCPY